LTYANIVRIFSSLTVQIEMTLPGYFVLKVTQGFVERVAFSHDTFQLS